MEKHDDGELFIGVGSDIECTEIAKDAKPDGLDLVSRRGPDWQARVLIDEAPTESGGESGRPGTVVQIRATVLHLRGKIRQPFPLMRGESADSTVIGNEKNETEQSEKAPAWLCWNGEVYQIADHPDQLDQNVDSNQNDESYIIRELLPDEADTETVAKLLRDAMMHASASPTSDCLEAVTNAISWLVNAEFAFCVVSAHSIYYGRDFLGRRSLLEYRPTGETTQEVPCNPIRWGLASVTPMSSATSNQSNWKEVHPGRIYEYDLASQNVRSMVLKPINPSPVVHCIDTHRFSTAAHVNISQTLWQASIQLEEILLTAIQRRLPAGIITNDANNAKSDETSAHSDPARTPNGARMAVMFSGGLDSAVLAALTLDLISPNEPLELWNVAFGPNADSAADRQAAFASVEELSQRYPHHDVRFICVDIDWQEVLEYERHILQLLHPKPATSMDFNISTALWFASRGKGTWIQSSEASEPSQTPYASTARVLLLGMGADEQMAGYGRHRKAYIQGGWPMLRGELDLDLNRLWERNLGRDDRIVSDHGREARFPYLDTNVMNFLKSLPLADVCNMALPPGVGDKQILRQIALRKGLETAGGLVKRAIQFGSRIAHVSDTQRFGSRRQAKGDKNIFSSKANGSELNKFDAKIEK